MLSKIVVDKVASFKSAAVLQNTKKVNLVYGLNGSGKSTICKLLRDATRTGFEACSLQKAEDVEVVVFNDEFIEENFYQSDDIKGIFSLSKQNKDAEAKLSSLGKDRDGRLEERTRTNADHQRLTAEIQKGIDSVVDKIFDIKRKHSGGDRVLEFCLDGVMAKKEKLFQRLIDTKKASAKPDTNISELQKEAKIFQDPALATKELLLPKVDLDLSAYEQDSLLAIAVVGSSGSTFAEFITNLQASDWVKKGLEFVDLEETKEGTCPFCQKKTIDETIRQELGAYFDTTFESQLLRIRHISEEYAAQQESLSPLDPYKHSLFYDPVIETLYGQLHAELRSNSELIEKKLSSPSVPVTLTNTKNTIDGINEAIDRVNTQIELHNAKIADMGKAKQDVYQRFWSLMRWEYDQSLVLYDQFVARKQDVERAHEEALNRIDEALQKIEEQIISAQQQTVNIDAAVQSINNNLLDIGITDFGIKKHNDHLYRLERVSLGGESFKNLSEGEKMIISLLYFCELCAGKSSANGVSRPKVAVFDDPVSSMSHVYVFNVGRILISRFFKESLISQVFVFTHSLYFFYELTDRNAEEREQTQALFRVTKGAGGSSIAAMRYEEIQNDYQAYWQLINDPEQHPAVIANCMRNVLEYFFGFVEKQSFANVFQKQELKQNRFQAFSRYMNRESHSVGQNVFDFKEFDYDSFRDGLRLVFELTGYPLHFKKMAKIGF